MVLRTLPAKLVKTMRRVYRTHESKENTPPTKIPERIRKFFTKLKNADRKGPDSAQHRIDINNPGFRVRKMKIMGINVIVKRTHGMESPKLILAIRRIVDEHNKLHPDAPYLLQKPIAYPIGEHFIAMSEAKIPSVRDIIGGIISGPQIIELKRMPRGQEFLERLTMQNPRLNVEQLADKLRKDHYTLMENIVDSPTSEEFRGRPSFMGPSNVLVAGYERGKFIFVPLIDMF